MSFQNGGDFSLPIRPGDAAHCPSVHTEAMTQKMNMKGIVDAGCCIFKVRLNKRQEEKTAGGGRELMYASSKNADLLANFRYDRVDLG